jgi:uncharacterized protein YjbJ (UPF0337 family)
MDSFSGEEAMNKDELKGKLENLKGRAKEAFGAATGNKRTEAEGMAERGKGAVQEKYGEAKDELEKERRRAGAAIEPEAESDVESSEEESSIRSTEEDED